MYEMQTMYARDAPATINSKHGRKKLIGTLDVSAHYVQYSKRGVKHSECKNAKYKKPQECCWTLDLQSA